MICGAIHTCEPHVQQKTHKKVHKWVDSQWDFWMFPKIGGFFPQYWWVKIMENPMNKWDDLGVPLYLKTPK